jgi:PTS system mannose-specific IID component
LGSLTLKLSKFELIRVIGRLLFLQALLHRRGMQNIGLASAMSPVSARFGKDDNAFFLKHLNFFNCNPNFTPLIVGGVLRLEEERMLGKPINDNDIEHFKNSLSSPLAAMGDMLFMGGLKPMALTFACIFAIYNSLIGLLAVFLLYNSIIISCRVWGIYFGYTKGWELVEFFSGPGFQQILNIIQGLGAAAGGVLVALLVHRFPQTGPWMIPLAGGLVLVTLYLFKKQVPASWFAMILFPASALFALFII